MRKGSTDALPALVPALLVLTVSTAVADDPLLTCVEAGRLQVGSATAAVDATVHVRLTAPLKLPSGVMVIVVVPVVPDIGMVIPAAGAVRVKPPDDIVAPARVIVAVAVDPA
jgi:hypothetical protein